MFGVKIELNNGAANIRTLDDQYSAGILLSKAGEITGDARTILSSLLILPPDIWGAALTNGIVHLEDPVYQSAPLVVGLYLPAKKIYLPRKANPLIRSFKTEEYVMNEEWKQRGKPVVVYGKY